MVINLLHSRRFGGSFTSFGSFHKGSAHTHLGFLPFRVFLVLPLPCNSILIGQESVKESGMVATSSLFIVIIIIIACLCCYSTIVIAYCCCQRSKSPTISQSIFSSVFTCSFVRATCTAAFACVPAPCIFRFRKSFDGVGLVDVHLRQGCRRSHCRLR